MPDYAGIYQLSRMQTEEVDLSGSDLEAAMESMGGAAEQYIEVVDGRTLRVSMGGQTQEMTYTAEGNVLTYQDEFGPSSFILVGSTLTWTVTDEQASAAQLGATGFTMEFTKRA